MRARLSGKGHGLPGMAADPSHLPTQYGLENAHCAPS